MQYTTYGAFQEQMTAFYKRTGIMMQFPEMMKYMAAHDMLSPQRPVFHAPDGYEFLSDEDFDHLVDSLPLGSADKTLARSVAEDDIIPVRRDVFVIRNPRYTRSYMHAHNYFEIVCAISGKVNFCFDKEPERILHPGEVVIIAPGSRHDVYIWDDTSTAYVICIRKSTFQTTFLRQIENSNLLSYFFQTILQDQEQPNFLMFYLKDSRRLKRFLRSAIIECTAGDPYSNMVVISLIQLIFIELLRKYSQTISYYNYDRGSDFSLVLQYIQHNYRTLSLPDLAAFFHYSEPHLCTLIKKNTGHTFSDLIRELRLEDAKRCLRDTDLKVGEIAEKVGYNSADHFFQGLSEGHETVASGLQKDLSERGCLHSFQDRGWKICLMKKGCLHCLLVCEDIPPSLRHLFFVGPLKKCRNSANLNHSSKAVSSVYWKQIRRGRLCISAILKSIIWIRFPV
jgi:AraC-like DNA-binding protein